MKLSKVLPVLALLGALAVTAPAQIAVTITATDVFVPPASPTSWIFTNGFGEQVTVLVSAAIGTDYQPSGFVVWSWDKQACRDWPEPGICNLHIDQGMFLQTDGSLYTTAVLYSGPGVLDETVDVVNAGAGLPFVTIPSLATSGLTQIYDADYIPYEQTGVLTFGNIAHVSPPPATRHTRSVVKLSFITTPSFSGRVMMNEFYEGPCFNVSGVYAPQSTCTHTRFFYAPTLGLVEVMPLNVGNGEGVGTAGLTLVR